MEEVSLDIPHGVLHAPLFMSLANATGADREAVVVSKVQIAWIELRQLTVGMLQDGGLTVTVLRTPSIEGGRGVEYSAGFF